jgi:hypothetical protein
MLDEEDFQGNKRFLNFTFKNSKAIKRIAMDTVSETLDVFFKDGDHYRFFAVDKEIFNDFVTATSSGDFFNKEIRDVYRFRKIS